MAVIELNDDNMFDYPGYIPKDMAENIQREFYRGFLILADADDDMQAGIIWQYHNLESAVDTESVIEWICIRDPDVSDLLFDEYTSRIQDKNVKRSRFVIPVKNSSIEKEAFKNAGFTARLTEGDNVIVSLSELFELPVMKSRKVPDNIGTLNEQTLRKFRKGIEQCIVHGRRGLCEDLSYLPMSWFEVDVSCYSKDEDNISGFLLLHKLPSGILSVQLFVGLKKNAQQDLLGMMRKFIINMEENYPPETKILLNRHTEETLKLTEKLLPRGFGRPVYAGMREE